MEGHSSEGAADATAAVERRAFAVTGRWPEPSVPAGTSVGLRYGGDADPTALACRLVTDGLAPSEGVVVVSVTATPATVVSHLADAGPLPEPLGVVGQPGEGTDPPTEPTAVRTVPLAEGFRALGEASQNLLEAVGAVADGGGVRLVFDSLTALLDRTAPSNVYRFLHIFGDRIAEHEALGLFTLSEAVEARDAQVVAAAFDRTLRVRTGENGWYRLADADGP